jgi:Amino acid transporters
MSEKNTMTEGGAPSSIASPKEQGLKKSLRLFFVFTAATGSIYTCVTYWDAVFYKYCGPGTFLAFALMTCAILPIAFVYSELAPMFRTNGGELIYNTVAFNKHVGFFSSWLIMAAWIAVPPAEIMGITSWLTQTMHLHLDFKYIVLISILFIVVYFIMSIQDVKFLVKAQAIMLTCNIGATLITGVLLLCSGHWHFSNFSNFFHSGLQSTMGIPAWLIGVALLITPFFGFETVPELVEEGNFPIKDTGKAIFGSVITCGVIYAFFFFCVSGVDGLQNLVNSKASSGYLTIIAMQSIMGWRFWPLMLGIFSILMGMGASLLGFWMATVRLLYAMSKKNYLPQSFAKVNKHHQPILPNIFLLVISVIFMVLQHASTFMESFFNLMAFGCACAYAITMLSSIVIHKRHPNWKSTFHLKGGNFTRFLAFLIALVIAFFCTLGQSLSSWICFLIFLAFGVALWLWMVLVKWRKEPVRIETPEGEKIY